MNYTQIYTEKNGPNNRLITKEKNQTSQVAFYQALTNTNKT